MTQPETNCLSDEYIHEQGYLVSRGVRMLALIGTCDAAPLSMLEIYTKLTYMNFGTGQGHEPIPLVMERNGEGCADYGYAQRAWVAETFQWASNNVPQPHLNRLLGLMLGYSADAIAAMDESGSGMLFSDLVTELDKLEPNSRNVDLQDSEVIGNVDAP